MKRKIVMLSILSGILIISSLIVYNINDRENLGALNDKENSKIDTAKIGESIMLDKEYETYSINYNEKDYKDLPINYIAASYAYDTSTPEKATGVADYCFIAKINGILRTEYRHPSQVVRDGVEVTVYDPYTVYSVEVIDNIKGEVIKTKSLEVVQHGGITSDGSQIVLMEGMDLLKVGEYYILLPYTASDGRLGISNSTSIVNLGVPSENEVTAFKNVRNSTNDLSSANKNERSSLNIINKYVEASENPVVPEGKTTIKSQIYDVELAN